MYRFIRKQRLFMIYMDNAATSYPKPPCVSSAAVEAIQNAGNPGRGIHKLAAWSSLCIAQARIEIAACLTAPPLPF